MNVCFDIQMIQISFQRYSLIQIQQCSTLASNVAPFNNDWLVLIWTLWLTLGSYEPPPWRSSLWLPGHRASIAPETQPWPGEDTCRQHLGEYWSHATPAHVESVVPVCYLGATSSSLSRISSLSDRDFCRQYKLCLRAISSFDSLEKDDRAKVKRLSTEGRLWKEIMLLGSKSFSTVNLK